MPNLFANDQFAADDQGYVGSETSSEEPDVAQLASGGFVAAWTTNGAVRVQIFAADGLPVGNIVTIGVPYQGKHYPTVTGLTSGSFVVSWEGTHDDSGLGIWAQLFDAAGNAVGSQFLLNSTTFAHQQQPDLVALEGGGFVASWTDQYADGSNAAIVARIFDASGAPVGGGIVVNTTAAGDQHYSKMTALPDGGFVVTWHPGVLARFYNADGTPRGGEIVVGATDYVHELAALPNGNVVIVWSEASGYPNTEIKARIYEPDGDPVGPAFSVNNPTPLREIFPSVAPLDNGGFVIAWKSDDTAEGSYFQQGDIYAQVFDQTGAKVGGEFLVNQNTDLGQDETQVVSFGSGDLAFLWRDFAANLIAIREFFSADVLTAGADSFTGTDERDFVFGLGGADQLTGGLGADSLDGGAGADTLTGGVGDDVYYVDDFGDVVIEAVGEGTDTVRTALGIATGGAAGVYYLPDNVEGFVATGNAQGVWGNTLDNTVTGTGGADLVVLADRVFPYAGANQGSDTVNSGGGDDYLFFAGSFDALDEVDGGSGTDVVALLGNYPSLVLGAASLVGVERLAMYSSGNAADPYSYNVTTHDNNVAAGQALFIGAGSLQAGERLAFNGSAETNGSFTVFAGSDSDTLTGGARADRLIGRGGADQLTGGLGNDVFQYNAIAESNAASRDTILDFTLGDKIDLWYVDANSTTGANDAFSFIGNAAFTGTGAASAGQLRFQNVSGTTWAVQGDTDGNGIADFMLHVIVSDANPITAGDFIL